MSDISNSSVHWIEGAIASGSALPPGAAVPDLVHSALTGTPDDTLADIATADAALEADIKDLAVKVNTILARLRAVGIIAP